MEKTPAAVFDPNQPSSPLTIPAGRTALLLMDYAHLTASIMGDRTPEALARAGELRDWALQKGIAVYHCKPDSTKSDVWPAYAKYAKQWEWIVNSVKEKPMLAEEPLEIALKDSSREKMMLRRPGRLSVLQSDGLLEELDAKNVRSLIIAGFSTGGCVLSSVRAANDLDYIVTVAEDACADGAPGVHEALTKYTFQGTAHVATVAEIIDAWKAVQ